MEPRRDPALVLCGLMIGAMTLIVALFAILIGGLFATSRAPVEGPAGDKHKVFVEITERSLELMVSDKPWSWQPVSLGRLSTEDPVPLDQFCWSADGSVLARAIRRSPEETAFYMAYDFREHERIGSGAARDMGESARRIPALLAERGGQGPFMAEIGSRTIASVSVWAWIIPAMILFTGGYVSCRLVRRKACPGGGMRLVFLRR
jgi:hypothetical protein